MSFLKPRRRLPFPSILASLVLVGGVLHGQEAQIIRTKVASAIVRTTPDSGGIRITSLPLGSILEFKEAVPDKSRVFPWYQIPVVNDKGDEVSGYVQDSDVDVINAPFSAVPVRSWVNDAARLLNAEEARGLTRSLIELDEKYQTQIVVLIIESYQDYKTSAASLETFASNVFNAYHIGHPDRNDGILILVSLLDRKIRISLGVGYEFAWEGKMDAIINGIMLPSFRNQDYGRGILDGVKAVIDQVKAARKSA